MVDISIKDAGYFAVTALLNLVKWCLYVCLSLYLFIWVGMHLSHAKLGNRWISDLARTATHNYSKPEVIWWSLIYRSSPISD